MPGMPLWALAENQNAIKVDQQKLTKVVPEHTVYGSLEDAVALVKPKLSTLN